MNKKQRAVRRRKHNRICDKCGSGFDDIFYEDYDGGMDDGFITFYCRKCGYEWGDVYE